MPFDPENSKDVSRLVASVRKSRLKLAEHRENKNKFQREYLGKHYSDQGADKSVPVNLVEQFISIYKRALSPTLPAAFITVRDQALLGTRSKLELGVNHLAREIDLERTLDLAIYDALMLFAIVKVGKTDLETGYKGYRHDEGQPFADHILNDDWVHDYAAKGMEDWEYAGDRSFPLLEELKDIYPKHADELSKTDFRRNEDGESRGDPVDRTLDGQERVVDTAGVWSMWLPREQLVLVMADSQRGIRSLVLYVLEYQGPETGPYHMLGFEFMPGSTIPLSPIATVFEMAKLHGALFRKSARQAENQKTVLAVRRSAAADGKKVAGGADMEVVTADDPSMMKDYRFNGADPQTLQMADLMRQLFSEFSGNLQLLGGLAPQSETLGQDRLLAENASERLKGMQKRVQAFSRGIFRDLAWWLFTDPLIELPLVKPNPGAAQGIRVTLTAADMEGDFLDYNVEINPYSMQARSPQEELNLLMSILERFIIPFRNELAQQGMTINFPALLRRIGELSNLNTLDEFLMFTGQAAPAPQSVGSPPQTVRLSGAAGGGGTQGGNGRGFQRAGGDMASVLSMISGQGTGRQREGVA